MLSRSSNAEDGDVPALKLRFDLEDEALDVLKFELIDGHLAVDENGRVLVWTGDTENAQELPPHLSSDPITACCPASSSPQVTLPPTSPPTPEAERWQLTVMFIDLVDSTALTSQLDPEDYRDVVRAYQQACTEVIHRYDGT